MKHHVSLGFSNLCQFLKLTLILMTLTIWSGKIFCRTFGLSDVFLRQESWDWGERLKTSGTIREDHIKSTCSQHHSSLRTLTLITWLKFFHYKVFPPPNFHTTVFVRKLPCAVIAPHLKYGELCSALRGSVSMKIFKSLLY